MNLNVQSLTRKQDQLELLLVENSIDVLCLTEHWFKQEINTFNMKNYKICGYFCRQIQRGGGSLILVKEHFQTRCLSELSDLSQETHIEVAACELQDVKLIFLAVYRSPTGNIDIFIETLNLILTKVYDEYQNYEIFIAGDFNINFDINSTSRTSLLEIANMYGLKQTMYEKSRISNNTATCIDNIRKRDLC